MIRDAWITGHIAWTAIYFLVNFGGFEWLYFVQYIPINTKLENVANFNVLFVTTDSYPASLDLKLGNEHSLEGYPINNSVG